MEIIREYENWRQIRDADGTEGWVNQTLLTGERTAVAAPWMRGNGDNVYVMMRRDSNSSAQVIAKLDRVSCSSSASATATGARPKPAASAAGVSQNEIWGAYPGEAFK